MRKKQDQVTDIFLNPHTLEAIVHSTAVDYFFNPHVSRTQVEKASPPAKVQNAVDESQPTLGVQDTEGDLHKRMVSSKSVEVCATKTHQRYVCVVPHYDIQHTHSVRRAYRPVKMSACGIYRW